jgi:two-component system sensor histidine kinase/response regulator
MLTLQSNSFQPSVLSQITHELRTPLTGILGMIHFLNQTVLTPEQKQYVDFMSLSAQKLLSFGDDLEKIPCLK